MGASVAAFVMANGQARLAMARAPLRLLQLHATGTLMLMKTLEPRLNGEHLWMLFRS